MKVYFDWASQPCRAVLAFCELNNIKYHPVEVQIRKGDNYEEDYTNKNPSGKVPTIQEIDEKGEVVFTLFESGAILKYLAASREVANHWYPRDDLL